MNSKRIIAIVLACMMIFTLVPTVAAEEHVHEWTETVIKAADCKNQGIVKKTCECGEGIYEQTDYAHETVENFIDATCTEAALITVVCKICEETVETKTVEGSMALGHDLILDEEAESYKAATCTEAGVDTMKCSRCDYTENNDTEALGHAWNDGEAVDADCENGSGVKYTCEVCGETKLDEFTDAELAVSALGHEYKEEIIAPTCKEAGYTKVTCTRGGCDYEETKDEVQAVPDAHSPVVDVVLKEATCTENGTGKYKCELCDADLGYKAIAASHDWEELEDENYVSATCGEDGQITIVCAVCGEEDVKVISATGEHNFVDSTKEATCTEPAMAGKVCDVCGTADGEMKVVEGSAALGHDLVLDEEAEDYKAATCTEAGVDTMKCSRCDYTENNDTEALGHTWDDGEAVDADCENGAGVKYACEVCGETKLDEFTDAELAAPALGHEYKEEIIAPTCKDAGYTKVTCTRGGCDYEETKDEVQAVPDAHTPVVEVVLKEATCTENGTGKYKCELCDADLGYKVIEASHDWKEIEDENYVSATCGEDGQITIVCAVCSEEDVKIIPTTGEHSFDDEIKPATCTEPAMVGQVCGVCGATDGEMKVVEGSVALGHDLVLDEEAEGYKAASCTETGVATMKCSRCEDYTETKTIEALGHTWDEGVWADADCENAAGIKYTCEVCDETKVDAVDGELAAPAIGHNYVETVVEPTCSHGGVTLMVCSNCGDSYEAEGTVTPAVPDAHIPAYTDVIKEANCTDTGVVKVVCEECEANLGYKTTPVVHVWGEDTLNEDETALYHTCEKCGAKEIIETYEGYVCPEGEHVATVDEAVAATCTANGITEGSHCKLCGEILTAQEIIMATGHTEEIIPAVAATCTDAGLTEGKKCSVCGEIIVAQEIAEATGHTEVAIPATAATCTESGLTEGKKCSVCDTVITAQETVAATGHVEVAVPAVAATCTEAGLTEGKKCSVCDSVITAQEAVAALGHDFEAEWTVDKEATVDAVGSKSRHCSRCDEVTDVIEIAKLVEIIDSSKTFKDLVVKNWSKDAIDYVVSYGYMNGTSTDTFSQEGTVTRAMFVTILWRLAGKPEARGTNPFTDLEADQTWYHDAVVWGYENGIVLGTSDTTFDPAGEVNREQMAVFLYRYAKYMEYDTEASSELDKFTDAGKVSSWAEDALSWAVADELVTGTAGNDGVVRLAPKGDATREQTAVILMRFCEKY